MFDRLMSLNKLWRKQAKN